MKTAARKRLLRLAGPAAAAAVSLAGTVWLYSRYRAWVVGRSNYADFALEKNPSGACPSACPPLSPPEANLIGWTTASTSPRAYFRVPLEKKPGVTRVGVFGCSYVAGLEAAPGQDFPNLLQERLSKAGVKNVEIVNFGVMGYGMDQAHMLWRLLHERYHLDAAFFMPMSFHYDRDVTFLMAPDAYGPVHGRYVLDGSRLELIPPVGSTPSERSAAYFRPLPPWRYWRYDDKPPAVLRALLPPGRRWKGNPFYYRKDSREHEALETYVELFRDVARAPGRLVVEAPSAELEKRFADALGPSALVYRNHLWDFTYRDKELFYARMGHMSALANWARAAVLAEVLTGKPTTDLELPTLSPPPETRRSVAPRLDEGASVDVRAGRLPAATFVYYDGCIGCAADRPPNFKRDGIAALVLDDSGERPITGTRRRLRDGEPVSFHMRVNGRELEAPYGVLRTADGLTGRLVAAATSYEGAEPGTGRNWRLDVSSTGLVGFSTLLVPGAVSDIWLGSAERRLLTGKLAPARRVEWLPGELPYFLYLRAPEDAWIDPPRYRSARTLDLVVTTADGREVRSPLFSITWRRVSLPAPPLRALTDVASGGHTTGMRRAK